MTGWICQPADALRGTVSVPGDKSISHRSLIFGALGEGVSTVHGLSGGEDNLRTLRVMQALGVDIKEIADGWSISGVGVGGLIEPTKVLECGNSGTSIRLLAGLLAGQPFVSRLRGDESLSRRPMNRVAIPLGMMGADVRGQAGAIDGELYPMLEIHGGPLRGIHYQSPIASAQVKSSILLAALSAEGPTSVTEPKRSRDHTERMLRGLGAPLSVDGLTVTLDPSGWDRKLPAARYDVPGDPSSAAFLVVAGLISGGSVIIENVCANPTRTGFLDVLEKMGATMTIDDLGSPSGEPVCRIIVKASRDGLRGADVAGELTVRAIDEIPILAIAAACASGETTIRDGAELRVKESDRIASTTAMLRGLGVGVQETTDGLIIEGRGGEGLAAGRVEAHGDHRIAMSAAVGSIVADGEVVVDDVDNVATSFPTFVDMMNRLGSRIRPT